MNQDEACHEVVLGPGHIVLDGHPAPTPKTGTAPPIFGPCQTPGWIKMPLGTEAGLGPGDIVLDGDNLCPQKGTGLQPPLFGPRIVAKRLH